MDERTAAPELTAARCAAWLPQVIEIAYAAGRQIMRIYESDFSVTLKADRSPLTEADLASQRTIAAGLAALTPAIPVLGEESAPQEVAHRLDWPTLWLVDPLDGTREFVKRNGEFTINIALVAGHEPVLGVLYAPARELLYAAARGHGAFRCERRAPLQPIHVCSPAPPEPRVFASRSHSDAQLDRMLERLGPHRRINLGSALKFGLLADGSGDLYIRRGPTSEWDTAAGHAVLTEAGGGLIDLHGSALRYNARPDTTNPAFIAYGDPTRDWLALLNPDA